MKDNLKNNDNFNKVVAPRVIMVETSHPGNIGAAARAMKTMNMSHLTLVAPQSYPDPVAFARSSGAADLLEKAQVFATLPEAIEECQIVVGVTARTRKLSAPVVTPKQLIAQMDKKHRGLQVGWVFGRERNGLSNEEIDLCNIVCTIPSNPEYGSLNIAAAVQILCYEWYASQTIHTSNDEVELEERGSQLAPVGEREGFYQHLWQSLTKIEFLDEVNPVPVQRKLRRLFDRARLSSEDINILRGILKNIIKQ